MLKTQYKSYKENQSVLENLGIFLNCQTFQANESWERASQRPKVIKELLTNCGKNFKVKFQRFFAGHKEDERWSQKFKY